MGQTAGSTRPYLVLAWFEGLVVSLGAAAGIVSTPHIGSATGDLLLFSPDSALDAFSWLLAYAIAGWLGWRIYTLRPQSRAMKVWVVMLACMLGWRPVFYFAGAGWPGAVFLALAAFATALLLPTLAVLGRAAAWTGAALLTWLGYCSVHLFAAASMG